MPRDHHASSPLDTPTEDTYRRDRRAAYLEGVRDQVPMLLGNLPFAFLTGAASTAAGLDPVLAMSMSIIIYAGASQLAALSLLTQSAPALIVIATVAVVNLRFMMYSVAMAPFFRHLRPHKRWLMAYGITDHSFALMQARLMRRGQTEPGDDPHIDAYFKGMAVVMWCAWQSGVAVGVFAGTLVPKSWSLDFAVPLMFAGILLPALQTRTHWIAAIVATVAAAFTVSMPLRLGLLAAALCAMVVGAVLDARDERFA